MLKGVVAVFFLIATTAFAQTPGSLGNISTRLQVGTGGNVMIAGFIIQGSSPKKVIIRALGPSLTQFGVPGVLANPQLELHDATSTIGTNDDWQTTQIGGVITADQAAEIQNSGIAPGNSAEPAIIATLSPGSYTAIVQGVNNATGVGIVEVYDLSLGNGSRLANISTRGFIRTGDNVMIGGFIVVTQAIKVIIRAIGPSLIPFGIGDALTNPQLELHDANGTIAANDDWQTTQIGGIISGDQVAAIQATTLAPGNTAESAAIATLVPGNYTAIVRGAGASVGVGLIEVFGLEEQILNVLKTGTGTGTVTSSPSGIDCGSDCVESYYSGTSVALTATPASGSLFAGWSGGCSGTGTCTITMDAAKSVTAAFSLNTRALTVSKSGNGSGTVTSSPAGINCGATCAADYDAGSVVTLTAAPSTGSSFTGWSGACSGTETCTVTIDAAKSVTASFALNSFSLSISKNGNGSGTVTSSPTGINCGSTCSADYDFNTAVTLSPAPSLGSAFSGWGGACSGTGACVVTMDAAKSVSASFTLITYTVSGFPSPQTAGLSGSITVTAKDSSGNTVTDYLGTAHFTSTDAQAVLPANYTFTTADAGNHTFSGVTLKTAGFSRSVTVTDTVTSSITGTQSGIQVNSAAAANLAVSGFPSPQTAGVVANISVTAKDAFNNTATGYTGTVHVTSNDGQAVLPVDYTFTGADAGVKFLSVTLRTVGTRSITVTDTVTSSITGTQGGIQVNSAAAANLTVSGFPSPQTAGVAANISVTAKDAFNNTATGYTGTVHVTSNDGQAVLPVDYTFTGADAGVKILSVTLRTGGTRSITATDTATASITGTQSGIQVNSAAAANLTVSGFPSPQTAGVAANISVTAKDAFNNTATAYTGTVHVTSNDGQAVLPVDYTFTGADAGVKILSVTLRTVGTRSITVTDTITASITGTQSVIQINSAAAAMLTVSGPSSPRTAGVAGSFVVTAKDAFNNTAIGYTGTVNFTSSDPLVVFSPTSSMFTGADAGVKTGLSATLKTAGIQSITATDSVTASITGAQTGIFVNPASTSKLAVTGFPNPTTTAAVGSLAVTAKDTFNNTTPSYTGTVTFSSTNSNPTLPANYTFVGGDAGVRIFSGNSLNAVGTSSITATDTVNGGIAGSQTGILVNQGPNLFGGTATVITGGSRSGQIFIAGGSTDGTQVNKLNKTWFYNPATSTLTAGPTLTKARALHTATGFGSGGQILVAGGSALTGSEKELEICSTDGVSASCTTTGGTLADDRCNGAAVLFPGTTRVLIAGGDNCSNTTALASWTIWDAADPTNPVSGTMSTGRRLHTATSIGTTKVLLAGGAAAATAELFTLNSATPASSTSVLTTGAMTGVRTGHTATVLPQTSPTTACPTASATNQCVLLAAGNATAGKTWEIYDPSTNTFPTNASTAGASDIIVTQRTRHAAAVFSNGKVLLAGGNNTGGTPLSSSEIFNPAGALSFSVGTPLQVSRTTAASIYTSVQNTLVLGGGSSSAPAIEEMSSP
jgi:hypothetical protein